MYFFSFFIEIAVAYEHFEKLPNGLFCCKYCMYVTANRGHMNYHQVKHSGARDFQCGLCKKFFAHKSNLKQHIRRIHGMEGNSLDVIM